MNIREATPDDNQELQELQAKCPQGKTLIVSIVNTPDFFARAKAYMSYKVFVAHEENSIIGSHACAMRNAMVNGKLNKIGYSFQTFISPNHRKKGLAKKLLQYMEDYLIQNRAALVYGLIMEGNLPSMILIEGLGFKLHRTLIMPGLPIYKERDVSPEGNIRPLVAKDLAAVANLLNETWQGYDLFEPISAEALAKFVNRTPTYSLNHLWVLEDQGKILACLGFWDWGQIMRITMKARSLKIQIMGSLIDIARNFRPLPRIPGPGDTLKQWCLTPIGFKDPKYLAVPLRYLNNLALQRGIEQIFCICERGHALLSSLKEFIHVDTAMHLYVKPFRQDVSMGDRPVFIDGIDL